MQFLSKFNNKNIKMQQKSSKPPSSKANSRSSSPTSDPEAIFNILKKIKFFEENNILDDSIPNVQEDLISNLKFKKMKDQEFVFHFGDFGDEFYIILEGSVKILRPIKKKNNGDADMKRDSIFNQTEVSKRRKTSLDNDYEDFEYPSVID